jgi:hypothetical protein
MLASLLTQLNPNTQTSTHYLDLTDLDHKIEAKDSDDEMERVAQKTRESIALRMEVALKAPVF